MAEFTPTQGRYLAFLHAYTSLHGYPPSESEMAQAMCVAPPSVNTMMKMLEKKGLISRQPGQGRSVRVIIPEEEIPAWNNRKSSSGGQQNQARAVKQSNRTVESAAPPATLYVFKVYLTSGPIGKTLLLFALLAVVHTWPLASAPGRLSRNDNGDTVLNEWILAWVAHQSVHDPLHLFDANIFYPDRGTLAYSEYLIAPAAMGAPLLWAGASPVLAYNLLVIAGLALAGWAGCLLLWTWTGDLAAGVVAGVVFTFNTHTLARLPQLQALHLEFLPFALLALDRLLAAESSRARRTAPAIWLAVLFALQGLTSYYSMMLTTVALAAGVMVRPGDWANARGIRILSQLALAASIAVVVMLPFLLAYKRVGEVRDLGEVALYSATWKDYLVSTARVHAGTWSPPFPGATGALFPGVLPVALAAFAIGSGIAIRDSRARMALAFGVAGVCLSFGPSLPGYGLLHRTLAPLQGVRNVARFGYLATIAAAVLSGFAVAAIRARWRRAPWLPGLTVLLVALVNLDAFSAPMSFVESERVSRLHARLRGSNAIVAHFPFFAPDHIFHSADYMLESTANWRPMINGYSGLTPNSYEEHARQLARFPDAAAIDALKRIGVTHVWVHDRALRDWTDNETADAVSRTHDLQLLAEDGDLRLYRVRRGDE